MLHFQHTSLEIRWNLRVVATLTKKLMPLHL